MPALAPPERARRAVERPRDHASHRMLTGHHLPCRDASRVQIRLREPVYVTSDLQHRVRRRVQDRLSGLEVMRTVVLDHLGAAVRAGCSRTAARSPSSSARTTSGGNPDGYVGQRLRRHHAHQLPVPGRRFLPRPEGPQAAVHPRVRRRRNSQDRDDRPQPQPRQRRQPQPADLLGQVRERVRAGVAV